MKGHKETEAIPDDQQVSKLSQVSFMTTVAKCIFTNISNGPAVRFY